MSNHKLKIDVNKIPLMMNIMNGEVAEMDENAFATGVNSTVLQKSSKDNSSMTRVIENTNEYKDQNSKSI